MHLDARDAKSAADRKQLQDGSSITYKSSPTQPSGSSSTAAVASGSGSQHGFQLPALSLQTALERVMSRKGGSEGGALSEGGMVSAAKDHIERQRAGQAGRSTAGQQLAAAASRSTSAVPLDRQSGGGAVGRPSAQEAREAQGEEIGAVAGAPSMAAAAVAGWSAMRMAVSSAVTTGFTTSPAKSEGGELTDRPRTAGSAGRTPVRNASEGSGKEEADSMGGSLRGTGRSQRPGTPPLFGGDRGTNQPQGQTSWSRLFG